MRNTNKVKRNGAKLLFLILIAFLLFAVAFGVFGNQLDSTAFATNQSEESFNTSGSYTVEEIQNIVSSGGQLYRNFRVYSDTDGVQTYQVPLDNEEADYLFLKR